ncbi:hypothetical protein DSD19_11765 [Rhodovulum sp. BSW8]|nr:hypothetical protein DSD19_11765 [Rhodovulum sp. BSW8]
MIGTLFGGIATSPWIRAALRSGGIALAVLLFLLSLRRSGERAGRLTAFGVSARPAAQCQGSRKAPNRQECPALPQ